MIFFLAIATFVTPPKWQMIDPLKVKKPIEASFIHKEKRPFIPSLNIAKQKSALTQKKYVNVTLKQHNTNKRCKAFHLGTIMTKSGSADLIQMDLETNYGTVRQQQMILIAQHDAYILTATTLKEDFGKWQSAFSDVFSSFTITDDLLSVLEDKKRANKIRQATPKKLPGLLKKEYADMGLYWQVQTLQQMTK